MIAKDLPLQAIVKINPLFKNKGKSPPKLLKLLHNVLIRFKSISKNIIQMTQKSNLSCEITIIVFILKKNHQNLLNTIKVAITIKDTLMMVPFRLTLKTLIDIQYVIPKFPNNSNILNFNNPIALRLININLIIPTKHLPNPNQVQSSQSKANPCIYNKQSKNHLPINHLNSNTNPSNNRVPNQIQKQSKKKARNPMSNTLVLILLHRKVGNLIDNPKNNLQKMLIHK